MPSIPGARPAKLASDMRVLARWTLVCAMALHNRRFLTATATAGFLYMIGYDERSPARQMKLDSILFPVAVQSGTRGLEFLRRPF